MKKDVLDDKLHWYKDAIIYELHIKAFRDSNGDGIGDFKGLLEKLDYVQDLGATAIWVLPFYPSPLKDDGYDIADYYSINPRYGTIEDFKQFLDEAHRRNLKVITELVVNHTSDQHPWFQRARRAPKGSPERDYYVWTDNPNQYKDVRIIFQDFEASNWTWDPIAQQYYWHRFFHHQPDLNYDNPVVQDEIFKVMDYWCGMGVDGFRLDAVPYLFEREGTNGENLPETHAFLKKLRKHVDEHFPGTVFLAEANMWPEDSASYFGDGDECHMNYHFPLMPRMFMALQQEDRYPITDIFDQTPEIPETCQWAMFLRNHDELTLEMVTDEERDFMYKVYAKDPKARINLGIRHRLAPLMDNNRRKIELMNSLLFSMPGTPVLYYGDEIGMGDNFYLGDRDGVRTPMQWSSDRNAGFSEANPHMLYLPIILDPEYHYESVNVDMQRRNTSSLFWFMKRIINMRRSFKAFSRGNMRFLNVENPKVLAFTRSYEDEVILAVVNLSKFAQPAEIDLSEYKGFMPVEVFSRNKFPSIKEEHPYFFTLGPHSFQWFVLQKAQISIEEERAIPELKIDALHELLKGDNRKELETAILPQYLLSRQWFAGKNRTLYSLTISDRFTVEDHGHCVDWLILEVVYESGLPETYQLAVSIISEETAKQLSLTCPEAMIAQVIKEGAQFMLCDAFYIKGVQKTLLECLSGNKELFYPNGQLHFEANEELQTFSKECNSRVFAGSQYNTAITYDTSLFLKFYRKVEFYINPDVEMSRFLSEVAGYKHTPKYQGIIEWRSGGKTMVLGMLQELIENHGNGHSYMLERVNNFVDRILADANAKQLLNFETRALTNPISFEELPIELQEVIGGRGAEQMRLLGERTAELHKALASNTQQKEFAPEDFSLHYQRSLFASMVSLVRETFQRVFKANDAVGSLSGQLAELQIQRQDILQMLKRVYDHKLEVLKIRNHGNFGLRQVLLTGKDLAIHDFGGNVVKSYSERRLKRSPLRDVAQMVCSIYYATYEGFTTNNHITKEEYTTYFPYAQKWAYFMSSFFIKSYLESVQDTAFVPRKKEDLEMLMQTYLVERSLKYLGIDLQNKDTKATAPMWVLQSVLQEGVMRL